MYSSKSLQEILLDGVILSIPSVVSVGQSFFTPSRSTTATLGDGREVWFGYRQTARPSMWKTVLLNVDSKLILCTYVLSCLSKRNGESELFQRPRATFVHLFYPCGKHALMTGSACSVYGSPHW